MRTLLSLTLSLLFGFAALAQCTPNTSMAGIIDPPKLPDGITKQPYSVNFSFRIPKDTIAVVSGQSYNVTVTAAELIAINGIPDGFTYACSPSNCTFSGGSVGCALLTGNPTSAQVGEYPIEIVTLVYFIAGGSPLQQMQSDKNYVFKINYPAGIGLVTRDVNPLTVFPNPAQHSISTELRDVKEWTMELHDITGKTVLQKRGVCASWKETVSLDVNELPRGLYTVLLLAKDQRYTAKVSLR